MKHRKTVAGLIATFCVIAFGAESCDTSSAPSSHEQGQKLTEQAYKQQSSAVPYPVSELKDSLERRNLRERLLRQNQPDRIGYVYFFPFGSHTALGYWTIKGKVSSTESQMTPEDLTSYACNDGISGCQAQTLSAPGDDGSYGQNEKGVFFFTTEGAMVQVCEDCYFYSDQPVNLGNIPKLGK